MKEWVKKRYHSFKSAFHGIRSVIRSEINFRIHLIILTVVVVAGVLLSIELYEWLYIIAVSSVVLSAEIINTAIEKLCDKISTSYDVQIKLIKDIASAGVLIAAIGAAIGAMIIFIPKIFHQF